MFETQNGLTWHGKRNGVCVYSVGKDVMRMRAMRI